MTIASGRYRVARSLLATGLCLPLTFAVAHAQSVAAWETPEYFRSGALAQINAAEAYAQGFTGAGVVVGVADSGLDSRSAEFLGQVLAGYSFARNSDLLPGTNGDFDGHGTHVAGLVNAARNGSGMQGVAFGAQVMPVALGLGSVPFAPGNYQSLPWSYLAGQNVPIMNASYRLVRCDGDDPCNVIQFTRSDIETQYGAIIPRAQQAVDAGMLMVFANGNDSLSSPDPLAGLPYLFPEFKDNWLAVGAVTSTNAIWTDSNRCGVAMAWCLVAPGVDLYSTARGGTETQPLYTTMSGTSQASPLVAGVAALVKEAFPWFTARDLQQTLLTTATDLGAPGVDEVYGWGMVNAGKAVRGYGMFTSVVTLDTQGYVSTFSNNISGVGGLVKAGAGTLILTGANSFAGGASVTGGMLLLASSSAAGTGAISVGNGAALGFVDGITVANALNVSGAVSFEVMSGMATASGALSGTGTLTIGGPGQLSLIGDTAGFPGLTEVGGTLAANGALAGSVNVRDGGTLKGSGSVGATQVAAGGTIAPGNSIGTLTINGALTFAPGSTYQVEIDASGASDRIVVLGAAGLGGATITGNAASGIYSPGTRYTILTATGGLTGVFGLATETFPFLNFALAYETNAVFLDIVRDGMPLTAAGATRNQTATAFALDALPSGNGVLDAVLSQTSLGDARAAFDALSGEVYPSALSALQGESIIMRRAVLDRARLPPAAAASSLAYAATSGADVLAVGDTPAAFWSQAFGAWDRMSGNGNAATLSGTTSGVIVGYDRTVSGAGADWRLGFAAGYSASAYEVDARASSLSSDNTHVAVYGAMRSGEFGLRLGGAYEWSDISGGRTVAFPGFSNAVSSDLSARTGQVFGEAGYSLSLPGVEIEPFAGLAYVDVTLGSFTETGGPAALSSQGGSAGVTYSTLGARASMPMSFGAMAAALSGTLAWQHAYGDTAPVLPVACGANAQPFSVAGVPIASDTALVEAGVDLTLSSRAGLSLFYAGQLAETQVSTMVKGTFSLRF